MSELMMKWLAGIAVIVAVSKIVSKETRANGR